MGQGYKEMILYLWINKLLQKHIKDEAGVRAPFNSIVHTQFRENQSTSLKGELGK
jgi:hypothetical protein